MVLTVMGQRERKHLLAVSVLNHFLSRLRQVRFAQSRLNSAAVSPSSGACR